MTGPARDAEIVLQTLQTRIDEDIDTAAIDIATTGIGIGIANTNARQNCIEAHGLGLAHPADHILHREHYNDASPCLHNPMRFQANWYCPAMPPHPRRSSPISTRPVAWPPKVIRSRFKGVRELS